MMKNNIENYQVPYVFPVKEARKDVLMVEVPGSKSITNRALLLAALANGKSILRGALFSDDSRNFLKCIQKLGFETEVEESEKVIEVTGLGGSVPKKKASIYVGSAGTAARFLTAWLGVSHGTYQLEASGQMMRRPMAPLLASLRELGCQVQCEQREGYFPFTLRGNGFEKHKICVDIEYSSQFLSALLITACLSSENMEIQIKGTHGMAYIEMTKNMMKQFGVSVISQKEDRILVEEGQSYQACDYQIEPDVSGACYFYSIAPLLGLDVLVKHVNFASLQGDVEFLRILEKMGCLVEETPDGIKVCGCKNGVYSGVDVNMSSCSDQAITLAALAPFATTPTTIRGIGHIRYQECDRIHAITTELRKMEIRCEENSDSITIYPGQPKSSLVETYEDHRMAMGFSLIGLRAPGITIHDPACCRKTFENYFQLLDATIKKL